MPGLHLYVTLHVLSQHFLAFSLFMICDTRPSSMCTVRAIFLMLSPSARRFMIVSLTAPSIILLIAIYMSPRPRPFRRMAAQMASEANAMLSQLWHLVTGESFFVLIVFTSFLYWFWQRPSLPDTEIIQYIEKRSKGKMLETLKWRTGGKDRPVRRGAMS